MKNIGIDYIEIQKFMDDFDFPRIDLLGDDIHFLSSLIQFPSKKRLFDNRF